MAWQPNMMALSRLQKSQESTKKPPFTITETMFARKNKSGPSSIGSGRRLCMMLHQTRLCIIKSRCQGVALHFIVEEVLVVPTREFSPFDWPAFKGFGGARFGGTSGYAVPGRRSNSSSVSRVSPTLANPVRLQRVPDGNRAWSAVLTRFCRRSLKLTGVEGEKGELGWFF